MIQRPPLSLALSSVNVSLCVSPPRVLSNILCTPLVFVEKKQNLDLCRLFSSVWLCLYLSSLLSLSLKIWLRQKCRFVISLTASKRWFQRFFFFIIYSESLKSLRFKYSPRQFYNISLKRLANIFSINLFCMPFFPPIFFYWHLFLEKYKSSLLKM